MLSLNGKWKVTHVPYCSPIDFILSPSFVPEGWLDAAVPEEIHRTLRNAGIIRGNVYGKTDEEELWIEQADWIYHKEFFVPAEETGRQVLLTFEGLDTFCDIYLNGILTGSHKNLGEILYLDVAKGECRNARIDNRYRRRLSRSEESAINSAQNDQRGQDGGDSV